MGFERACPPTRQPKLLAARPRGVCHHSYGLGVWGLKLRHAATAIPSCTLTFCCLNEPLPVLCENAQAPKHVSHMSGSQLDHNEVGWVRTMMGILPRESCPYLLKMASV